MTRVLIIGSGPSAAAVALAAQTVGGGDVEVVDVGERLEGDKQDLLAELGGTPPSAWPESALLDLTQQPVAHVRGELPQKRVFGSDFPFRDRGQLGELTTIPGGNKLSVSAAFGGFSNVWGAQIMPFSRATLDEWPIGYEALLPHYKAILRSIPFAGADDDYSDLFPVLETPAPLPRLAPPAAAVLARYEERRDQVRRRGVTVGSARLAMDANRCIECGLCLTGCPYGLIYSSAHTFKRLIDDGDVRYSPGVLVDRIGEDDDGCWASGREVATGEPRSFRADRLFVACGGIGSTRLLLNSARPAVASLELAESVQVVLPFLSARPHRDPRTFTTFTLNQFNLLVEYGRAGLDLAQFHLYPYNPAFEEALPAPIRGVETVRRAVLRRTTAALAYLPSWHSPRIRLDVTSRREGSLPDLSLSSVANSSTRGVLRRVFWRLIQAAPALDLWPAVPVARVSGPAKSYHFGASFPHMPSPSPDSLATDTLGRIAEWKRVHVVDGSVLPTIPATTFTLTVMANAHRIATAAFAARGA
jgi:choline dehydrogenase-like flavoprotein